MQLMLDDSLCIFLVSEVFIWAEDTGVGCFALVPTHCAHRYTGICGIVTPTIPDLASGEKQADRQTFQVFTGAAPGGSSTSAIHGSRKTWKV
jgi:hypothetical protein